jgi:hypothetical protein
MPLRLFLVKAKVSRIIGVPLREYYATERQIQRSSLLVAPNLTHKPPSRYTLVLLSKYIYYSNASKPLNFTLGHIVRPPRRSCSVLKEVRL